MISFRYDHTGLSLPDLHRSGIRGTREIEEVFEGYSFARRRFFGRQEVYYFTGFTKNSKPLHVALSTTDDIITLGAIIPPVEMIVEEFCRHCS